jgi:cation diffusion facilitator family transporter
MNAPRIPDDRTTRRNVLLSLGVNGVETLALGSAAWMTGSVGLRAQTAANAADLAVVAFLLIGVLSSARPADDSHPLGYGRERFFWSLFAALGIFVGGAGLALAGAVDSALHPSAVDHYAIAYFVLATTVALDTFALVVALKPVLKEAATRGISLRAQAQRSTDPAALTVVIGGACAVLGAIVAAAGLVASQLTGSSAPDTAASAFIGLVLLVASIVLLRANRALLSGRGVAISVLREMHRVVAAQPGIVAVPDLFAVVVGPSSLIVDWRRYLRRRVDRAGRGAGNHRRYRRPASALAVGGLRLLDAGAEGEVTSCRARRESSGCGGRPRLRRRPRIRSRPGRSRRANRRRL